MRYIDRHPLQLPDGWLARAQVANDAVANGDSPNDHASVWRELKDGLGSLFHDKCWYCEVTVTRSDNAVDHFRPKGRVSDAQNPHTGYRWLAFDRSNFRYACTYCNCRRKDIEGATAGGKADRFPLIDENQRVYAAGSVAAEQPTLLDPCTLGDWRLLGCMKENGKPCAAGDNAIDQNRAETSIEVYHLHHAPTCTQRHSIAVQLLSDIEEAKGCLLASQADAAQEVAFKKAAERILRAINAKSQFSGAMHFLLRGERDTAHPWIQELLETN
jgi:hypothetical protein